jgi:micrococcal nuclease
MRLVRISFFSIFLTLCASACGGESASMPPAPTASVAASPSRAPAPTATAGTACIPEFARRERALVTKVTDGDSIEVEMNGVPFRVRYIGIDAPEMTGEAFAGPARAADQSLVEGKEVILIRDLAEADAYGRLLRYVFSDGVFVNREMVRLGMARARSYPPNTACDAILQEAQTGAKLAASGIWGNPPVSGMESPGPDGGAGCAAGCATPPAGCPIKGNINIEGVKIYHLPAGRFYEQTLIEPEKGERWFCSEEEAVAAGWRKSKQ